MARKLTDTEFFRELEGHARTFIYVHGLRHKENPSEYPIKMDKNQWWLKFRVWEKEVQEDIARKGKKNEE